MFNFSKTDKKQALIDKIIALPNSTSSCSEELVSQIKSLAISRINARPETGCYISIHAHTVDAIHAEQIEIQITGINL